MKNLIKIVMVLMLLLAPMTMSAQSAAEVRQTLTEYCEEKNQDTPIQDGDNDAYYVHFAFEDNQMNIVYGVGTELFAAMRDNKEALLQSCVEELSTDDELLGMVALLTICDGTLAFIVCDYNGEVTDPDNQLILAFEEDDLKAIIANLANRE